MENPNTNEEMKKKNTRRHRTRKRNTWLLNLQPSGSITDAKMVMIHKTAKKKWRRWRWGKRGAKAIGLKRIQSYFFSPKEWNISLEAIAFICEYTSFEIEIIILSELKMRSTWYERYFKENRLLFLNATFSGILCERPVKAQRRKYYGFSNEM